MTDTGRTTYQKAISGYDSDFERAVADAVTVAIAEVSRCTDAGVMALRVGETVAALVTVLAGTIALSPAVTRSPTQLRKFLDEVAKRLRRKAMEAAGSHETKRFKARCFGGTDVGGHA
jgi:tetrahydromethanopterin S-methyltransferase subunit E